MAVSLLMWFLGLKISEGNKPKLYLVVGIVVDVTVLGIFKYFNFFAESFFSLLKMEYSALKILLPVGISFYLFQSISYLADVYKQKINAEKTPLNVLLYIGFFPQIVSGPIVKARDFIPQLHERHLIKSENVSIGFQKILIGIFKKKVIADRLAVCVNAVYAAPAAYSSFSILLAVITYSLQIYYDFSGYTDIAIGVARIIGFDLGENFNLPYLAKNPSEFWQRWHISLSSWFREYVYFPLGGNRKGKIRTYFNILITMLISGLWHGASWAFVVWGVLHAVASMVHKIFVDIKKKMGFSKDSDSVVGKVISIIINFCFVTLLWVPFRTNDLGKAVYIIKRLFSFEKGITYVFDYSIIFIVLMLIVEVFALLKNNGDNPVKPLDLGKFRNKVIMVCLAIITFVFAYIGNTAFIYAQF